MEFCAFDQSYLERLRAGDFRTQEHFASYFGKLIQLKVRSQVRAAQDIEDIRQETLTRVLRAVRTEHGIREPERLGAYVLSTCRNVLLEHYRPRVREIEVDEDDPRLDYPDPAPSALDMVVTRGVQDQVREILDELPERDRRVIRAVLLEERSKDEICEEMGVDRAYLRVLVHRAKQSFKDQYERRGTQPGSKPPG